MVGPMAVGGLVGTPPGDPATRFLGTCFALRRPDYFVTAKHVVTPEPTVLRIAIGAERETAVIDVADVARHERADLAILRTTGARRYVPRGDVPPWVPEGPSREARERAHFVDDVPLSEVLSGVWYESYGFATDLPTQADRGGLGEARCFRGYIHRPMTFSGGWGTYRAIELSEGVPGGASGAPIYDPETQRRAIGVATTTLESEIPGQAVTEDTPGEVVATGARTMTWRVGVGLLLGPYRGWLDEQIPR